jgi:hypothetical protein
VILTGPPGLLPAASSSLAAERPRRIPIPCTLLACGPTPTSETPGCYWLILAANAGMLPFSCTYTSAASAVATYAHPYSSSARTSCSTHLAGCGTLLVVGVARCRAAPADRRVALRQRRQAVQQALLNVHRVPGVAEEPCRLGFRGFIGRLTGDAEMRVGRCARDRGSAVGHAGVVGTAVRRWPFAQERGSIVGRAGLAAMAVRRRPFAQARPTHACGSSAPRMLGTPPVLHQLRRRRSL